MSTSKGKQTFYPNKVVKAVTTTLTQESHSEIDRVAAAVSELTGKECSRADLLEHGWRSIRGIKTNPELTKLLRTIALPKASESDTSLGGATEPAPAEAPAEAAATV